MPAPARKAARAQPRLGVDEWRSAALRALAEEGIAAVAIEPLARRLGVTKGSGYWHFESREDLLRASLDAWETRMTDDVIAKLERLPDPVERLTVLFREAFGRKMDGRIWLALTGVKHPPFIADTLRRVSSRRIDYLTKCYEAIHGSGARARHRAVIAYAAYLGVLTLQAHQTDTGDRDAFIDELIATLI